MGTEIPDAMYAIDVVDDIGFVSHEIVDDGLGLNSHYIGSDGTANAKIGWESLEKAEANYENARVAFMSRIEEVRESLAELDQAEHKKTVSRIKTLIHFRDRTVKLFTSAGPPIWWLPKFGIGRDKFGVYRVRIGWLYRAYVLFMDDDR